MQNRRPDPPLSGLRGMNKEGCEWKSWGVSLYCILKEIGEPMKGAENRSDDVMFLEPHQDPHRAVLDALNFLETFSRTHCSSAVFMKQGFAKIFDMAIEG